MASGKVKFFNAGRGYGFIVPDDGGNDVFLHITALKASKVKNSNNINEGDKLTYDVEDGPRGPAAVRIARS